MTLTALECKTCTRCGKALPLSAFRRDIRYKGGVYCYCRKCEAVKGREDRAGKARAARIERCRRQAREAFRRYREATSLSDEREAAWDVVRWLQKAGKARET